MAKEIKVQETIQSDFSVVVNDIAEELLTRLNMDEDGSVIDMFQTGSFDPVSYTHLDVYKRQSLHWH